MTTRWRSVVLSVITIVVLVVSVSTARAGTVDTVAWNANRVTVRMTNIPVGTRVTVCVYDDAGCEIKGSARSIAAPATGVVNVIVPAGAGETFVAGDTGRVSDPDCFILEAGGTGAQTDCSGVCETCEPPIPTLSEWAAIGMAVLLLTAGAIVFFRVRRAKTAAA